MANHLKLLVGEDGHPCTTIATNEEYGQPSSDSTTPDGVCVTSLVLLRLLRMGMANLSILPILRTKMAQASTTTTNTPAIEEESQPTTTSTTTTNTNTRGRVPIYDYAY